jgi:serine/threonine protein kinase
MRWLGDESERQQIENEVKAATTLCTQGHPNIIQTFEHGALDRLNYFIDMELCNLNLRQFLRGDKVKPDDWFLHWPIEHPGDKGVFILALMQEIANGLYFIHGNGVVHMDLKPENSITPLW